MASSRAEICSSQQYFLQDAPELGNQYEEDTALVDAVTWLVESEELRRHAVDRLRRVGGKVIDTVRALGDECERDPPRLVQFDAFGRRVDQVQVSRAWMELKHFAAVEGLVRCGYSREYGDASRVVQAALLHMFGPFAATYNCPLAMTDGAARVAEVLVARLRSAKDPAALEARRELECAFKRLTSSDPAEMWTSGQWMTERPGGSDVSRTETRAWALQGRPGWYRLRGFKWFTSATDADMALLLARVVDERGRVRDGSRGLGLFLLRVRDDNGSLNGIRIHRLKDKLGTRALPTAELELCDAQAIMVGSQGQGVRSIATMLNVTRLYNSVSAVAIMRHVLAIARDYAGRRFAFGSLIAEKPLHQATLAALDTEYRGCLAFSMYVASLTGKIECATASAEDVLAVRLLTPVLKLFTGRVSVSSASEALECLGGTGYVENTRMPRMLREAQVLTIWEGTTNVLSLDVLRVLARAPRAASTVVQRLGAFVTNGNDTFLRHCGKFDGQRVIKDIQAGISRIASVLERFGRSAGQDCAERGARTLAMGLAQVTCVCLLVHECTALAAQGHNDGAARAARAACLWVLQCFRPLVADPVDGAAVADAHRRAASQTARVPPRAKM